MTRNKLFGLVAVGALLLAQTTRSKASNAVIQCIAPGPHIAPSACDLTTGISSASGVFTVQMLPNSNTLGLNPSAGSVVSYGQTFVIVNASAAPNTTYTDTFNNVPADFEYSLSVGNGPVHYFIAQGTLNGTIEMTTDGSGAPSSSASTAFWTFSGLYDVSAGKQVVYSMTGNTLGEQSAAYSYTYDPTGYNLPVTLSISLHAAVMPPLSAPNAVEGAFSSGSEPASTSVTVQTAGGAIGQTITLSAALHRDGDNALLPGRSLSFYVANTYVGTVATDSSGVASLNYTISDALSPGAQTVTVKRLANSQYAGSQGTGTLTVSAADTAVAVANVGGKAGQTVTLSAVLTRTTDNAVLSGRSLSFYVNNAYVGTVTTNGTGTASINYFLPGNLGAGTQLSLTVKRLANAQYNASQGTGTLTVTP